MHWRRRLQIGALWQQRGFDRLHGRGDGTAYLQGKITLNGQPYLEPLPIYIEYAGFRDTQVFSGGECCFPICQPNTSLWKQLCNS